MFGERLNRVLAERDGARRLLRFRSLKLAFENRFAHRQTPCTPQEIRAAQFLAKLADADPS
jgi:hypothetical protein